jgi:long-chain acyl-CoA synthetase
MEKKVRLAMAINRPLLAMGIDIRKKLFGQITDAFGGELKSIVCGGAPISPEIIKDFYQFGITVLEGYGITECSPLVAVNSPGKVRFHSVGTPVVGCQVKIDKTEEEETGEILVKGENVMMGYYENEEATKAVFTEDGWFRTGDIGYMDKDGYVFITGRKKNVIILSNGKNVFPEELEEYLAASHDVLESVVVAAENAAGKTVLTALIVPVPELLEKSDEELSEHFGALVEKINKTLPSHKQILSVRVRREEFEKNSSKKIMRYKIQY